MSRRYVHLSDYNSGIDKSKWNNNKNNNNNNNNIEIQKKIDLILTRLNHIEAALAPTNIIKATPIMSIIAGDIKCLNKISDIYARWITYTSSVANSENIEYNVEQLFWKLDHFIFEEYFATLKKSEIYIFEFVDVDFFVATCTPEQCSILNIALSKDRDENFKFLYPPNKEFISSTVTDKTICLVYFGKELHNIINQANIDKNKSDYHFSDAKLHSALSLNNDVIGASNSVNVNMSKDTLDISDIKDKRHYILGNKRPLYNNLVDIIPLNKFNSSLYKFSPTLLNLSLVIFHAMLHVKKDIFIIMNNNNDKNNHDNSDHCHHDFLFTKEYLNYTPSALYGLSMIPPLTLPPQ